MSLTYINGAFVDSDSAQISTQDRGFRFGDGLFETMLIRNGAIYQRDAHMERLSKGLETLKISLDLKALKLAINETLIQNDHNNGTLRLAISRGIGSRGYLPTGDEPTIVIECMTPPKAPDTPVRLCVSQWRVIPPACLPSDAKLSQGVNYTLARMEAYEKAYDDALMLSVEGNLAEASSYNLFWMTDGTLYTPSLSTGALAGTTRAAILRLYDGIAEEVEATLDILTNADAVFITNAAMGLRIVQQIEGLDASWPDAKTLVIPLKTAYANDIEAQCG